MDRPLGLHLPLLQRAASENSRRAQRRYLWETAFGLGMLVIATIAGATTLQRGNVDRAGVIAAFAFVVATILNVDLLTERPERIWYEGRAVAESAKTLAWRYAVGGEPLGVNARSPAETDALLLARLGEILTDLRGLHLVPPTKGGEQITSSMRTLRGKPLAERKAAYAAGRIDAQRDWYAGESRRNHDRARTWNFGLLAIQALGAMAALLKATSVLDVDLLGLAGAVAVAGTSWLQARQHTTLADAYSIAAHELAAITARIDAPKDEGAWALFVDESEEAISREHTLWRASRLDTA